MIVRFTSLLLLVVATLLACSLGVAQRRGQAPDQARRPAAERIEQFKKLRLMEILGLDEQTSIRFFARYNKHQETMRDVRQKQMEVFQQIQSLRRSQAPDADYQRVLSELRGLEQRSNETKLKYMDELSEILTKKQVAEYIVFEVRFQQNLRDLVRDLQPEGGGGRD
jgi:hypothetical protein